MWKGTRTLGPETQVRGVLPNDNTFSDFYFANPSSFFVNTGTFESR